MARRLSEEERQDQEALQRLEWIRHLQLVKVSEDPKHDEELKKAIEFDESDLLLRYRKRIDRTKETIFRSLSGTRMIGKCLYQMAADTSITWRLDELAKRLGPNAELHQDWLIPGFGGLTFRDVLTYRDDGELRESEIGYVNFVNEDGVLVQRGFPSNEERDPAWAERLHEIQAYADYAFVHGVPRSASAYKSGLEDLHPPADEYDFQKPRPRAPSPFARFVNSTQNLRNVSEKQEAYIHAQRAVPAQKAKRPAVLRRTSSDKDSKKRKGGLLPAHRKPSQVLERCEEGDRDKVIADDDGEYEDASDSQQVSAQPSLEKDQKTDKIMDKEVQGTSKVPNAEPETVIHERGSLLAPKSKTSRKGAFDPVHMPPQKRLDRSHRGGLLGAHQAKKVEVLVEGVEDADETRENAYEDIEESPEVRTFKAKPQPKARKPTARTTTKPKKRDANHVTFKLGPPDIQPRTPCIDGAVAISDLTDEEFKSKRKEAQAREIDEDASPRSEITVIGPEMPDGSAAILKSGRLGVATPHASIRPIPIPSTSRCPVVSPPTTPRVRRASSGIMVSPKGLMLSKPRADPTLSANQRSASVTFNTRNESKERLEAYLKSVV